MDPKETKAVLLYEVESHRHMIMCGGSWPPDVTLDLYDDGSLTLSQAGDETRLSPGMLKAVIREAQDWLLYLTPWPERRDRELFEEYQTGLLTRQELIDRLILVQYNESEASEVQG